MKILQLHTDYIEYEPVQKEVANAEEAERRRVRLEDLVVLFVSVEEGDDESTARRSIEEIKESLKGLKAGRILIYPYSHLSSGLAGPDQALEVVKAMEFCAGQAGLEVYRTPFGWTKAFSIAVKGHPLAEQSKTITTSAKALAEEGVPQALLAERGLESSWHIISPDGEQLPIQSFDFTDHRSLEKLAKYEMAKERAVHQAPPHVALMKRLGIADYEPGSDPGNLRYYPKGRLIKSLLEQLVTQKVLEYGGMEVETPVMYDIKHPSLASYLQRFPARQYVAKSEDRELFLRFSACFGQFLIAKDAKFSYRQMPLRLYELTRYSFRREKSGELVGLRRLRAFTMPDCHALCSDMEQAKEEAVRRLKLSMDVLEGIGLGREDYEMAIRFTEDFYRENKDFVASLVALCGRPALVEVWKERFFYFTLKWELNFIDNLGKASALSTDQIDIENAGRYGIKFTDKDGKERHPIILHNSPSGAIERCIFALLEKAFKDQADGRVPELPLWLSPIQLRLIPVSDEYLQKALELAEKMGRIGIRADVDEREESVPKRVRDAEMEWVRYIVVLGKREVESGVLSVRDRRAGRIREMRLEEVVSEAASEVKGRPFQRLPLPMLLSKRPQF